MSKLRIKQEEELSIKFSHLLARGEQRKLDLYFSLPKEMGIGPNSLNEEEYYFSGVQGRRAYYSEGLHLPLVQSRFVSQKKRTLEEFRLYMNLFAYQYAVAMENDARELARIEEDAQFFEGLNEFTVHASTLLRRFRRGAPADEKWRHYFENADNYLSWFTEQQLLKLLSKRDMQHKVSERVLQLCHEEQAYRKSHNYNSERTREDPNRIANKMLLLRRLIQQGVVLKEDLKTLGVGLKKLTTGFATALVMLVVSSLIIKAQGVFNGLTLAMVFVLALIYGAREIFKDDVRNALWRIVQKGRPRWSRILTDTTTHSLIARQLVWLEFVKSKDLPDAVNEILKRRHSQNKVDAEILHYGISTRVEDTDFLTGYNSIQEQVVFSLVPFVDFLEQGKDELYREQGGEIIAEQVERRYQINLVVVCQRLKQPPQYARYKITVNRRQIVEITMSDLPENVPLIDDLVTDNTSATARLDQQSEPITES